MREINIISCGIERQESKSVLPLIGHAVFA